MPKIINAYADGSTSLADSLKTLGENMFGDQSKNAVLRETAKGKARENDAADQVAKFYADGDYRNAGAQSLRANPGATNMGAIGLAGTALDAGSNYRDPKLATMALGAGHSAEGTFPGLDATLAQRARAASEATSRAAATQIALGERTNATNVAIAERANTQRQWDDEHTLVNLKGPDGRVTMVPKSQVGNLQAHGYEVQQTLDQRKADMFAPPPASAPQQSGAAPMAAPGLPPTAQLDPDRRSILGLPVAQQSYTDPVTGRVGISQNSGQSITLADGSVVPAQGSGFQPVSHEAALAQTQDNRTINAARVPLPAAPTQYSQAAVDAERTSGLSSALQHDYNAIIGFFGGHELGADTNRARENLNNNASFAREVLGATPGRAAIQAQKWSDELVPHPQGFAGMTGANGETEKNKIVAFTKHMRTLYQMEATEAEDRNTAPDQRRLLLAHMSKLKRAIEMYETPAASPASGAPGRTAGQQPPAGFKPAAREPSLEERVAEARRRGLMQ